MTMKLFDSELKIMEILWREGDTTARRIAEILNKQVGWSKTTTYTVIKKCLDKGAIERQNPNFVCRALVSKAQAQEAETTELINKLYNGSKDQLIASLLGRGNMTPQEIEKLKQLVGELD